MTHYHTTPEGNIPFTPEEEIEWDLREAEYAAQEPERQKQANKEQASTLLQATDWVELGDVADPANPPYLSNKAAFTAYRAALRSIAVNPPTTPAVFPAKPDEIWLS